MSLFNRIRKLFSRKPPRGTPQLESKGVERRRERSSASMPVYPSYRSKKRAGSFQLLSRLCLYALAAFVLLAGWCFLTLPNIDTLNQFSKAPSIIIKSEDGQIVGSFGDIYGDYIPYDQLPRSLIDAVIATEDRNFYHHFGIDPYGLLRASLADLRAGHVVQGGSTITQQVAKNVFLTPERSLTRKLKEMMLAIKLERRYSKQEILSIYLNRVYLGAGNYGVDAAAHRYFGKSARDLTLPESAIIAGLLKAPSRFAPTSNPQLSRQRATQVLLNMQDAGYLNKPETQRAIEELDQSMSARKRASQSAMYFADWIMDQLPEYVGNVQEDLVVTTTIRPELQALAEKSISDVMDKEGKERDASQAALVSMTPDGAIRAMIGGRSYGASQFNRATQSLRPPGSAFKLFVYLAGLESGLTPDTMVEDKPISVPIVGGTWEPKNYTNKYLGVMSMKDAVTESVNTVAVQVALHAGLDNVINMARRLGITSDLEAVPSIALGSTGVSLLELTNAYAHLAAGGAIVYPYGITEIDAASGTPIYVRQASGDGMVLRPDIVGQMNEMLMSVVENGTGRAARIGRPAAGKTGTTSDYRDAWFIGFVPQLVTGVWVGNDDNTPMKKVTGGILPAQIWHDYMITATANLPVENIPTGGLSFLTLPWESNSSAPAYPEQPQPMAPSSYPQQPGTAQRIDRKGGRGGTELPTGQQAPQQQGAPLPWQQHPQAQPQPAPKGPLLGADFWDKLF